MRILNWKERRTYPSNHQQTKRIIDSNEYKRRNNQRNMVLLQQHHGEGCETTEEQSNYRSTTYWMATLLPRMSVQDIKRCDEKLLRNTPRQP